ncbi:hypothetical protein ACLOJK_023388 [Asimina triloba]
MERNFPSISLLKLTLPFERLLQFFCHHTIHLCINITHLPFLLPQHPLPSYLPPPSLSWPWPGCNFADLYSGEIHPHGLNTNPHVADFDLSSSLATAEDLSDDSSLPNYLDFNNNVVTWPISDYDDVPAAYDYKLFPNCMDDDVCGLMMMEDNASMWLAADHLEIESPHEAAGSSSSCSEEMMLLLLPSEDMEVDDQVAVLHLQRAHGEAVEMGLVELAEVIVRRISEKVGPLGTITERVGHHLYQSSSRSSEDDKKQVEYLKQESRKYLEDAFRALYEACPWGRFAHLAANMVILEAIMPKGAPPAPSAAIHIVDFDTREGIQWPSLLEILAQVQNSPVRFTSMKWRDSNYSFEPAKKRLREYARSVGLVLEVDEMDMEELRREMKKRAMMMRNDWTVFNCMVGLPHMGLERSRRDAWEFLRLAKEHLMGNDHMGIVTFGCGDGKEMRAACSGGFGSYYEECMGHFQALFESMEWHFPPHLSLARTAMECLFVGPYVSSHASHSMWEEMKEAEMGLFQGGWRLSKNCLVEAKELVREGTNPYAVKLEGECENEMVLEWKGSPLVRVYAWN